MEATSEAPGPALPAQDLFTLTAGLCGTLGCVYRDNHLGPCSNAQVHGKREVHAHERMSLAPTRLRLPTLRYAVISNGIQQAPHDVPMGSVSAARVNMLLIPSYDER